METLLPELYGIVYSKLDSLSGLRLAMSHAKAYCAFMLYVRYTASESLAYSYIIIAQRENSRSMIDLCVACGNKQSTVDSILKWYAYNARCTEIFPQLWQKYGSNATDECICTMLNYCGKGDIISVMVQSILASARMSVARLLMLPAFYINSKFVCALWRHANIDPSLNDNCVLRAAVICGKDELVRDLLKDPRVDPCVRNHKMLREAVDYRHENIVKILLDDGRVDPTYEDSEVMFHAIRMHEYGIMELLLKDGRADPTEWNNRILYKLTKRGDVQMIKRLLQDGRIDINAGLNVRKVAIKRGYDDILKLFDNYVYGGS